MAKMLKINHVTLVVSDLEKACEFYENEFGLEALPAFKFDFPAQFYKINETQQLHLTEWEDTYSFRGHICVQVDDFSSVFHSMKKRNCIDITPWGKVRRLPDGALQMFVRDPAGNLVEVSSVPHAELDPAILTDELYQDGIYVSDRNDGRGLQSEDATLYHE